MTLKNDPKFKIALIVSSLVFFGFAVPTVYHGSQTVEARRLAQRYFDTLQQHTQQCAQNREHEVCGQLADNRIQFDRQLQVVDDKLNATKILLVFAAFVPMLVWAAYFLTRAVFGQEKPGRHF